MRKEVLDDLDEQLAGFYRDGNGDGDGDGDGYHLCG